MFRIIVLDVSETLFFSAFYTTYHFGEKPKWYDLGLTKSTITLYQ